MKNKYLLISLIAFLAFMGITINYYYTNGYQIDYIEKNNITKTDSNVGENDTLLPVGYLEFDEGVEYWGYINIDGEVAISLTYNKTYEFDENYLAVVKKNNRFGLINKSEERILPIENKTIEYMGNQIYYYQDETSGHLVRYDRTIKQMIALKNVTYDEVGYFNDSLAYVVKDKKLGYINHDGDVVIELNYDFLPDFNFNFCDGFSFIFQNNKFGVINKYGMVVLIPQLDEVLNDYVLNFDYKKEYYDTYTMVPYRIGDLWGYMKRDGTPLIEPQFLEAYPFTDDSLARVKLVNERYNFINENGDLLSTNNYVEANDFYHGYAMASFGEHHEGLINSLGQVIVDYEFDYVGSVSQNMILTIISGHSKYYQLYNDDEFITINYHLGDDMTDCRVVFASDESGEDKLYVILNREGQRIYNEVTPRFYEQIDINNKQYICLVAYEEASNLEYYTYIYNGNLLWKVYKD